MSQRTDILKTRIKEESKKRSLSTLEKRRVSFSQSLSMLVLFILVLTTFSLGIIKNTQAETLTTPLITPLITNTATASFSINGSAQSLSDSAQFTKDAVVLNPMTLQKQANKSTADIGDLITYTLTINNPNDQALDAISVQDSLPSGLTYISDSATLNNSKLDNTLDNAIVSSTENSLTFTLGKLPAKSTWSVRYQLEVTANAVAGDAINRAIVRSDTVNSLSSDYAQATVKIKNPITNAGIFISKQGNRQSANINDEITYSITIRNQTERELKNLIATDFLPDGFVYLAGSTQVDGQQLNDTNISANGRTLEFSLASLGDIEKNKTILLSYKTTVTENTDFGDAINEIQAGSDVATSNLATATVNVRTPSTIEFLRIASSSGNGESNGIKSIIPPTSFNDTKNDGTNWQEIRSLILANGSTVSLPTSQLLTKATEYTISDPVIIQVTDLDQNIDSTTLETILITIQIPETGDTETLRLTETAPDSGIFRGVIQTTIDLSKTHNGRLSLIDSAKINVNYRDTEDSTDISATAALVVPPLTARPVPINLNKTADKNNVAIGELVRYTLKFKNSTSKDFPIVKVQDTLPAGFQYLSGSATLNGETLNGETRDVKLGNKIRISGRSLIFDLQNMPKDADWTLDYVTQVSAGVQHGKAINKAQVIAGQNVSNIARATVTINDDLMRARNILGGRVYIGCEEKETEVAIDGKTITTVPKVLQDARIYLETGRSILSDEEGYWHMEGIEPGSHVLQLDEDSLPNGYEPLLCQDNTRHAGDAKSKFVDLQPGSLWQVDFHVKKIKGYIHKPKSKSSMKPINPIKLYDKAYLENAQPDFEILWPKDNYVPPVASTKILVKSPPHHKVEVILNDRKVSPLNYDGSDTNSSKTATIRRWAGVDIDIKRKNNSLLVILKDKSGNEIARKTHNIHFSGEPASAELLLDQSVLVADGKTTPVIALLIKDEDGFPMRGNTHGYYTLENNNYQPKTLDEDKDRLNLNESLAGSYKYLIGEGGIAHIELNPTTQSGEVKLNLRFNRTSSNRGLISTRSGDKVTLLNNDKPISVWLKPHLREWILVGIAEGTVAHKTLSGNLQTLKDLGKGDKFYKRGRVAFFAKGQVKGKYLLTLAYDTHKRKQAVGSQLNGNIDPDAWYTIYGDNSHSQYNAPSSRKLYVKIEKDTFYALFGDYHTNLTVTELARYERVLNGFKSEYKGKRYDLNTFISETSNEHQHREFPGDGTSGLYYLSRDIIPNSEAVRIETRDRFHSDQILERRELIRYQDYDIDYQAGTLFFKFPVTGRDQNFNPNIIIVDYDTEDNESNKSITAGGRVALKSLNGKLETGLSVLHKGRNKGRDDRLIGTDITYDITANTKLHVEAAQSKTEQGSYKTKHAYIAELEREIENMEARVYFKKQDGEYGIDSQVSEGGIRKSGAEVRYKLNHKNTLTAEVSQQKNLATDGDRQLAEIGIKHRHKQIEVSTGARHTREEVSGKQINNNALLLGGRYTTKNGRVTLRSSIEKNVGSNSNSANSEPNSELNPDRLIVGADFNLNHGFTVFAEHETTTSNSASSDRERNNTDITTHNSRLGISKQLWQGASAKSTFTQERTDQRQRNYATLGVSQKFKVTDKIRGDFSVDKAQTISDTGDGATAANPGTQDTRFNINEPAIQGTQREDYTAYAVGFGSNNEDWSWTTRFELRHGEVNDKQNITGGLIRYLNDGKNLSAKFSYSHSENDTGSFENFTRLSLGSAWHPKNKNFAFLNRLDLVDEDAHVGTDGFASSNVTNNLSKRDTHTKKIIHNFHYNQKVNTKTQFSIHHGIKHINEDNKNATNSATIDTATFEVRRDITKKFDIGAQGGYLHDWRNDSTEAVAGMSVGVTPVENAWISLGYNFQGFSNKENNEDFDKSDYTRKGPYVNFRYKFNQDSFSGMNKGGMNKDGELSMQRTSTKSTGKKAESPNTLANTVKASTVHTRKQVIIEDIMRNRRVRQKASRENNQNNTYQPVSSTTKKQQHSNATNNINNNIKQQYDSLSNTWVSGVTDSKN